MLSIKALEQPKLSNLRQIPLDYDVYSYTPQLQSNNLVYNHIEGVYNSTGIVFSTLHTIKITNSSRASV
jgi:hypothetical protein